MAVVALTKRGFIHAIGNIGGVLGVNAVRNVCFIAVVIAPGDRGASRISLKTSIVQLGAGVPGAERMIDELLSLRVVVASQSGDDHDLFRRAASSAAVPIDIVAADSAASAKNELSAGADLLYLDDGLVPSEISQAIAAARAARNPPFTVLLSGKEHSASPLEADALAGKPVRLDEARQLIERSIRVRLPSRALVVDDSATMRSIVRRLLGGTRFPLEVSEADEGFAALQLVREGAIDIVFLDHNMPGFSGLETIAEFKREKLRVYVVLMTSLPDDSLRIRAGEQGAAFLKKPFYPADIEAVLCHFYGLRALNPKRA